MIKESQFLANVPKTLTKPLLQEYREIVSNFLERRWKPSELSGARFSEIVYTILDGYASGSYAGAPNKPANFVDACRRYENNTSVPRSFQILIPRLLPALYEVRNNRNVGHVGGDVDSNQMDAEFVLSSASWVLAELVRVLHNVSTEEAQRAVDGLAERRTPLVWVDGDVRRVLNTKIQLKDEIVVLLGSSQGSVSVDQLLDWTEVSTRAYLLRVIRQLHKIRFVNLRSNETLDLLPPGSKRLSELVAAHGAL